MKLFVLLSRIPYPLEKGDKLRAFYLLKELKKNHEIFLCCLDDQNSNIGYTEKLSEICDHLKVFKLSKIRILFNLMLSIFSRKPFQVAYFYQNNIQKKINKILDIYTPDHIYCQLIRTTEYVKNYHDCTKTLDYQDALSKGIERREKNAPYYLKPILKSEKRRLLEYENIIFEYFDTKTIISAQDRDLIYHKERKKIIVISNGIDTKYFSNTLCEKKFLLVFTGNMSYQPNIETALYLANSILPLLKKSIPHASLLIAGASPTSKIKALQSDSITVSGWMEDIRDAYNQSSIFIAPMHIGTGLQNKLLEAMSMKLPSITSVLVNNALGAINGKSILVAKTREEYVFAITSLLTNKKYFDDIADEGRNFVQKNYSWRHNASLLNNIMQNID
jgi:polysaccharide biosynthesis protein PslH